TGLGINEQVTLRVRAIPLSVACGADFAETTCNALGCGLVIDTLIVTPPSCTGLTNGSVVMGANNGLNPVNFFLDGVGPLGPVIGGISDSPQWIVAVDGNGCTDSILIAPTPLGQTLDLSFGIDSVSCAGASDGAIALSVSNGSGNFTYLWNTTPVSTTATINGLTAGEYTVTVNDVAGCSTSQTVSVSEPAPLFAGTVLTGISCQLAANGMALADASGGTAPYTYLWSTGESSESIDALDVGLYDLTITDANLCTAVSNFEMTQPDPVLVSADSVDVSCSGGADGQLFCTFGSTVGTVSFLWSGDNGFSSTVQNPIDLPAGNYCVTITDSNGCSASTCTQINAPTALALAGNTNPTSCWNSNDGTAMVMASGGTGDYTYAWNDPANQNTPIAIDLPSGGYVVTVTDENACTATLDVLVGAADPIQVDLTMTSPACFDATNGTASAVVSGGVGALTFQWDANAANQTTATATNLPGGFYCLTVSDANACTVNACIEVSPPPALLIENIDPTAATCFGNNDGAALVMASGGMGAPYNYLWSDPNAQSSNPATNLLAGMYTVTVSDAMGCSQVETVLINQPDSIALTSLVSAVNCFAGTDGAVATTVEGGIAPFVYQWSDGQTTETAIGLSAGNIGLTLTDANNCVLIETFTVGQPANAIDIELIQTSLSCLGEAQGVVEAMVTGGIGPLTYAWNNGAGNEAIASQLAPIVYTLTVTDGNNCSAVETILVEEYAAIEANLATALPSCYNFSDGGIEVNFIRRDGIVQDLSDYRFVWNTNDSLAFVDGLAGGQNYTVTITDVEGCTAVANGFLEEPDPIGLTLSIADASCAGGADGEATVVNAQGPNGPFSYQWDTNAANQNTARADSLATGIYTVRVSDTTGCWIDTTVVIGQPDPIQFNFGVEDNLCPEDALAQISTGILGGTPGYQLAWSTGSDQTSLDSLSAGRYYLTLTDGNNCLSIDSVDVPAIPPMSLNPIPTDPSCVGDRDGRLVVEVSQGQAPYQFSLDGVEFLGTNTLIGLSAGTYEIFVRDANDCLTSMTQNLFNPPLFEVEAGEDIEIVLGDSLQLLPSAENSNGAVQFSWSAPYDGTLFCAVDSLPCIDPLVRTLNTITYELYGIDEGGCEATDEITIRVQKPRGVHVPTAFTPNGDRNNDLLLVHGQPGAQVRLFQVFDRWGELVFEARDFAINNEEIGWNGQFRGKQMNTGVYVWLVGT
ncbi:MAG: gliding motility-associated C-terminal domain-containing protein, partial [Bacteroidota bacterium]